MVKLCSDDYPAENEATYAAHFDTFGFPLSPFQKHAIEAIVEGHHVLVTAHTGSGKTLPAEFAIRYFTGLEKKIIYCSPIKALSNQKYQDFTQKFPHLSCGLFTGDIKTNPNADVLIMTTEILMNYLFTATTEKASSDNASASATSVLQFQIDIQRELACVVFDEVHYINDKERGQVWEKSILMLPAHVQMIMLSATIDNPAGFAEWCERKGYATTPNVETNSSLSKQVYLASTHHRVVPLTHYGYITTSEMIFKRVRDKVLEKEIRDSTNTLIPLVTPSGQFQDAGYHTLKNMTTLFENNGVDMNRKHVLNQLAGFLRDRDMLPAIAFVFSRKHVELCARDIHVDLLEFDSKVGYTVRRECEQILRKLPNFQEYLELPEYVQLVSLLEKGIGIHHSGMIPILREIVEWMISKKYIRLLFATESFAIGLDCPIRTAVFTSLTKFDGRGERYLMAHEYSQMAGRAGRRGIDTVGHVVHCNNLFDIPLMSDYKTMVGGIPQKLVSKFRISYSLILNLLKNGQTRDFHLFSEKSMVYAEIQGGIRALRDKIAADETDIAKKRETIALARTPEAICESYLDLTERLKNAVNRKRKDIEKELRAITDTHRFVIEDVKKVQELRELEHANRDDMDTLEYMGAYIQDQTQKICDVLTEEGFVEKTGDADYALTKYGVIASHVAEIHPLILTKLASASAYLSNVDVDGWNYLSEFTSKQIVGLFSCFTDVKVVADKKAVNEHGVDDVFLKQRIRELDTSYRYYQDIELGRDIRTGLNYEDSLIYDMVNLSMRWCDCIDEMECKTFIQTEVADKGISIGDFTKALLKIVTISKEWIGVCELVGAIDFMFKLKAIEGMVLKYVATTQSLYV